MRIWEKEENVFYHLPKSNCLLRNTLLTIHLT